MDAIKRTGRVSRFKSYNDAEIFAIAQRMMCKEKAYLNPGLTMETMAAHIGVHRNSFSRAVNHYTGVSFPTWLATLRMAEADRLLHEEKDKPTVSSIVSRAGFSSRTSYYRAVQKVAGLPALLLKGLKLNKKQINND